MPLLPPAIVPARNIRSNDRQAFEVDRHGRLSGPDFSSAGADQSLRTVLDQHALATQRQVPARRSSPSFNAVADDHRVAKRDRRRAERLGSWCFETSQREQNGDEVTSCRT